MAFSEFENEHREKCCYNGEEEYKKKRKEYRDRSTPYFDVAEVDEQTEKKYEYVNHPSHYNMYSIESIDMIEKLYGLEFMPMFCEATALLYRLRMGTKPENSVERELNKEKWWLNKRDEYKKMLNGFDHE